MQLDVMWMLIAGLLMLAWMLGLAVRQERAARARSGHAAVDRERLIA